MALLKPYRPLVSLLAVLTILGNALNLVVPKIVSRAIDAYTQGQLVLRPVVIELSVVALGIFVFLYLQNVAQTLASERVAQRPADAAGRQDLAPGSCVHPAGHPCHAADEPDVGRRRGEAVRLAGGGVAHLLASS